MTNLSFHVWSIFIASCKLNWIIFQFISLREENCQICSAVICTYSNCITYWQSMTECTNFHLTKRISWNKNMSNDSWERLILEWTWKKYAVGGFWLLKIYFIICFFSSNLYQTYPRTPSIRFGRALKFESANFSTAVDVVAFSYNMLMVNSQNGFKSAVTLFLVKSGNSARCRDFKPHKKYFHVSANY